MPDFDGLGNLMFAFDFKEVLSFSAIPLIFVSFCGDFFSTLGTVLGVGAKAGMLDENGNLPNIQKPFLVDAIGTCVGACTGNTVVTTFVESSAGVEAGGRTGFCQCDHSYHFALMVFLSPLVLMIPNAATGPALIFVGFLMIQGIQNIDFSDFTEAFGPFVMIMFTIFTGSIAAVFLPAYRSRSDQAADGQMEGGTSISLCPVHPTDPVFPLIRKSGRPVVCRKAVYDENSTEK